MIEVFMLHVVDVCLPPLPSGEVGPKGRVRGLSITDCNRSVARPHSGPPSPQPSPGGRGGRGTRFVSLLMGCILLVLSVPLRAAEPHPVPIFFDTDMDTDVDDVGALAMLHAMADEGEVTILATVVSSHYPYSAPCVEAINRYYGRPDIPIGAPKLPGAPIDRGSKYAKAIGQGAVVLKTNDDADDAVTVYRRVLAAAPDDSVVIVTVGYLTNLRYLLASKPDAISPLTGLALVKRKVHRWVCMGGRYPEHMDPHVYGNFKPDPAAAVQAVADWPGPIYFSGIGADVLTGRTLDKTPDDNPIRRAYKLYLGNAPARPSWDETALLFAVRPDAPYWHLLTTGSNHIFPNGTNRWEDTPDLDHIQIQFNKDADAVKTVTHLIEDYITRPPKNKPPG
ncbi:MAG: nucleoside hydrolase [Planctomycetes bacterium]|nr:nucleoside hydrolase [Planctomycetota bacterium]